MSVFAYTPHRPEISYTQVPCAAMASNSSMGTFRMEATSSIKAPVPPAQLPFMRVSATSSAPLPVLGLKKIILASWPPNSMAVRTWAYCWRRAMELATTS